MHVKEMKEQIEAIANVVYDQEAAEYFLRELIANKIVETKSFVPRYHTDAEETLYFLSDEGKRLLNVYEGMANETRYQRSCMKL
jgi:hypothetical protein